MSDARPLSTSFNVHGVDEIRIEDKRVDSGMYSEGYFWVTQITLVSSDGRSDVDISAMSRGGNRIPVAEKYDGIDDEMVMVNKTRGFTDSSSS